MAGNPALPRDVAARWRPLSAAEETLAQTLLSDAWGCLVAALPTLPGRMDSGEVPSDLVIAVECAMVLRVMRNPEGRKSGTRSIDDYTDGWVLDESVATGALYATPDELARLSPSAARRSAFSITPGYP